ncbi:peroxiredoxin [Bordetella pseudohinzii]|uniref:thioredoxin-dependent peroxiredoxin n=1 Tax=Bordetella pseudohinzii TaxID=1331258 RepID=A0A0J6C169_9BORD|nr:peroxiredoxin [Bordetella pseudohinzii]ANY18258.1 peroxiredoxin [Bordetella pseudohinzii]KMM24521.1 peroxiredoxin [Bordetella pseudohinzii]KXA78568.1 peroxiredoxin [Bordetella pseudohinzii]KXA78636.1 peroxiredoxin [Bordetella pseudohinzii]CUJ10984.1 Putative peroxiredoxin Rv2521/MT2597 [Bordetella pseudohinzii]
MKQHALILAAALALAAHGGAALAVLAPGAKAPAFTAQASQGGQVFDFDMAQALKKGPVVLYFYPAAFTQGCTIEARNFAEAIDEYRALGATVIGVSADDIETLKKFSVSECRGKFAVAADADGKIMKAYDAVSDKRPESAKRTSYVISPAGEVVYEYTDISPEHHVPNTLKALRAWRASHPSGE